MSILNKPCYLNDYNENNSGKGFKVFCELNAEGEKLNLETILNYDIDKHTFRGIDSGIRLIGYQINKQEFCFDERGFDSYLVLFILNDNNKVGQVAYLTKPKSGLKGEYEGFCDGDDKFGVDEFRDYSFSQGVKSSLDFEPMDENYDKIKVRIGE